MSAKPADVDLPQLVRRGTGAVFAAQLASQVVAIGALACLARLVSPDAFGVIGVALPIVMLPRMAATLGYSTAAIQDVHGDEALLSGLFWRTTLWSLVAALVTAAAGPVAAGLYKMPELAYVAPALAVGTALNALSVLHLSVLERRLQLGTAAGIRLIAQSAAAIAAVALAAAWKDAGVWALVAQHVGEMLVLAAGVWLASSWRPSLAFTSVPAETRRFGGYYALSTLIFYAAQNADKLLLAAWLGSSQEAKALVGMYAQAYNLLMRPVYFVTTPIHSIMLPTLSRVQHDPAATADWSERFYRLTALMLLPAGIGLSLVAEDLMPLLAPQWKEAGSILALLAPIMLAQGFINLSNVELAAARRSGILCGAALVQLMLLGLAIWAGASFAASDYAHTAANPTLEGALSHQTLGAAAAVSTMTVLIVVPYTAVAWYIAGVPFSRFFRALALPFAAALAMGVVVYLVREGLPSDIASSARLAICVGVGCAVYGILIWSTGRGMLKRQG